nr:MAG TPA: hypothetical protein [Caudoviricetes sp.]
MIRKGKRRHVKFVDPGSRHLDEIINNHLDQKKKQTSDS